MIYRVIIQVLDVDANILATEVFDTPKLGVVVSKLGRLERQFTNEKIFNILINKIEE
jgi:hypothetical protein